MSQQESLIIVDYRPEHHKRFKEINEQWIKKNYFMEEIDQHVVDRPDEHILKGGGIIIMAEYKGVVAGTCSLINEGNGIYELTKMAVDENFRGFKIGYQLFLATIDKAKKLNAKKIILFSNTKHSAIAIDMYRKGGFKEVPLTNALYQRADIKMEMDL
jgi:N-acetylglutamate synthase-like GNAT family acetyltransferase